MVKFFPSIHPSLRISCRNASKRTRATGSSAWIQETYAEDFSWLLRLSHRPTRGECESDSEDPQPFWILDTSTWLPSTGSGPEFIEGSTGFRLPIVGKRIGNSFQQCAVHKIFPPIENRLSLRLISLSQTIWG